MKTQIERRLAELHGELVRGQHRLEALERERQEVRDTMLRISGAIQVLEELLGDPPDEGSRQMATAARNGRTQADFSDEGVAVDGSL